MKLVINSTDFANISTALYYETPKFIPSWFTSDSIPTDSSGEEYICLGQVDMLNDLPNPYTINPNEYYEIDEGRYYAFISPEIKQQSFADELQTYAYSSPTVLNPDLLPKIIYYHGSKTRILERDFAEYDFSWLVDKGKFNSDLKIQSLDNKGKELIGKKVEELTRIEEILFPSQYTLDSDIDLISRNYFGTTQINSSTFFVFPVELEIGKIELYDTILDENVARNLENYDYRTLVESNIELKPCLTIYLGCDYRWKQTDSGRYILDPAGEWADDFRINATQEDFFKGIDEENSKKIVWMSLDSAGQITNINLSLNSWKTDTINPERNKWKYSLRNDEFWSTKDSMSLVSEKSNKILVDGRSNTILATEKVQEHPILTKKLKKFNLLSYNPEQITPYNIGDKVRHKGKLWECLQSYDPQTNEYEPGENSEIWNEIIPNYSPYCIYRCGEYVIYDNSVWESLDNDNLGNNPHYSNAWIYKKSVNEITVDGRIDVSILNEDNDYLNTRVSIIVSPSNSGYVNPAGQVTLDGTEYNMDFIVIENLGYKLNENINNCVTTEINDSGELLNTNSITITPTYVDTASSSNINIQREYKIVQINISANWDKIRESKKLIFNFEINPSTVFIQGYLEDELINTRYNSNNADIFISNPPNEEVLSTIKVYKNGNNNATSSTNQSFPVNVGDNILLKRTSNNNQYKVSRVLLRYTDGNGILNTRELIETQEDEYYKLEDSVDYSKAIYTYFFNLNTNRVSCIIGLNDFEMTDNMVDIPYGENHTFSFYRRDLSIGNNIRVTLSDDVEHGGTWSVTGQVPLVPVQEDRQTIPIITDPTQPQPPFTSATISAVSGSIPYYEIQLNGITGYIEIKLEYIYDN